MLPPYLYFILKMEAAWTSETLLLQHYSGSQPRTRQLEMSRP